MSASHDFHLLAADSGITEGHRYGAYLALCGAGVAASELPGSLCPGDCEREPAYCLGCLRAATERNSEAGLDVDCPPGSILERAR